MVAYMLKAITGAELNSDRTTFSLRIETDQGPISLSMDRAQMDRFAMLMEGIEQKTLMMDHVARAAGGKEPQMRFLVPDMHRVGRVDAQGVPSVALVLKAGASVRAYALRADLAESIAQGIAKEIPKLDSVGAGKTS
jgi:hypothetical protein